ncbi:MAG: iron chelate uptake ABC transporter family permease subunit [Nonomuraea sp.]|nr:iron chelate uptake ABC transporter family permease subunit [Nonomuraea sp.]NUP68342.1 iron chelate uptake ABC transporter family permease subunit [Nonomuraea sp.]NUP77806.1 iron chelate uptake ABC transporter family permease subunit [Nonomuraea sp.]NUS04792.1 iron chelate uptake ABC transporter family permease subunit [Nonomuraea sp.]NUT11087.1 iron chelate uptake ABC transporter family permease subunit [Nonomuraea sp.]
MTLRFGAWSVRLAPRSLIACAALAAVGCAVAVAAIATGEFTVSVPDILKALFGQGTPVAELIVSKLRAPRVVTGLLVGAAFGAGGAIFQSLTKNPLGSPDFIGFTAGASTGGIIAVVAGGSAMTIAGGALAGCVVTALLVYALAFRRGVQGYRLVLVGIGANTLLLAVNNYLLTRANINDAATAGAWLTGSLGGRGWNHALPVGLALVVLLPVCALIARPMRMIEMGDDAAKAMGVNVEAVRAVAIAAGVLLTGVATAAAGPVVFVALAAPQIARRLTRSPGVTIGASALMGAVLLTASDLVAQRLLAPTQLPVGVVTAAVGGTYLALLLRKDRH